MENGCLVENEMNRLIEKLKSDFCVNEDLSDIEFLQIHKENYKSDINENAFGEKLCTLYTINFTIFNLEYNIKILVFIYEKSCEVLKLDLKVQEVALEQEISVCRNYLQRHRNLNSTFLTLKQFSRLYESRRLVINILLKREPRISLHRNEEGAFCIKYICDTPNIMIEVCWKIEWRLKSCDIVDLIEVYYNDFVLPNSDFIKNELEALTHHCLDFNLKVKLWKQLLCDLSKHTRSVQAIVVISDEPTDQPENVLVISDSEDDKHESEERFHRSKRRKIENNVSSPQVINVAD